MSDHIWTFTVELENFFASFYNGFRIPIRGHRIRKFLILDHDDVFVGGDAELQGGLLEFGFADVA